MLSDARTLGRATAALFEANKCMRSLPKMGDDLQDKGFLEFVNDLHLTKSLSVFRASGVELEAPDGVMLTKDSRLAG